MTLSQRAFLKYPLQLISLRATMQRISKDCMAASEFDRTLARLVRSLPHMIATFAVFAFKSPADHHEVATALPSFGQRARSLASKNANMTVQFTSMIQMTSRHLGVQLQQQADFVVVAPE
jgi:hypothetical protein